MTPRTEIEIQKSGLVEQFRTWRIVNRFNVALFDLDDTLVQTYEHFYKHISLYLDYCVTHLPHLTKEQIFAILMEINDKAYATHSVNPNRWDFVVTKLDEHFGTTSSQIFSRGLPIIAQIYETSPQIFPESEKVLQIFLAAGFRLALITHAGQEWTKLKLETTKLDRFFNDTNTFVVSHDEFKNSRHWKEVIEKLGTPAHRIIAVGDNVKGDIQAAREAGVEKLVWLPGQWSVYNDGEIPQGTITVNSGIGQIIYALLGLV